jgi:hypothetical protein
VFKYINADGTERLELRHPDDVFESESLASMKMIPVTVLHPQGLVTSDSAAELMKGTTGENIRPDGRFVVAPITVTHQDGIQAIANGTRELSLGYTVDLLEESGVYDGVEYTHRQRNIRYNHLAIVPAARAGSAARINMDGAAVQATETDQGSTRMIKVKLDGIEYEAAPEVVRALEKATARADQEAARADQTIDECKENMDKLQAQLDEAKAAYEKMKEERGDAAIEAAAQARIALLDRARKVVGDSVDFTGMSARDVMAKVITTKYDSLDLSTRSEDYIVARFDAIIEVAGTPAATNPNAAIAPRMDADAAGNSEKARKDANDSILNQWNKGAAK